ncbi:MAG: pyrroline-5-carboxylate reductase [Candidatus Omnitrophica bacterium]|nr:pyrroline-5-carboxylate reductase [Candidatus Omnitrophota bacterium]MDD5236765.1 pyrroline-5-carboxylate reductase [Candidatus Omnitrophota bacterium]MDD5610036.1 pyrroline-5-carboxylate reductase [Candidatus Omnitrophota bacterium]
MKKSVGIIGCGNMGRAIAERISRHYKVHIFDKDKNKTRNFKKVTVEESARGLSINSDVIILAVKPQDFDVVLAAIKDYAEDKMVISIAAGISAKYIEKRLGKVKVIRVMPNLPAKIGKGMICLAKGKFAKGKDLAFARQIFNYLGKTLVIQEKMMNAATAVSGSGPGFLFAKLENKPKKQWSKYCNEYFIPELREAAINVGFSPAQASLSAIITTKGSLELLKKTYYSPGVLCSKVASKGGTTEAGLRVLDKKGLNAAVEAAVKRAVELLRS